MKYQLCFSTRYDEVNWNKETYRQEKKKYLLELVGKYKKYNGQYIEGQEHLEFPDGCLELAQILINECELKGYFYDIGTFPIYLTKDIKNAQYVPFNSGSRYDTIDCDEDYVPFNFYKKDLCSVCGIGDLETIPTPYKISKKIMHDGRDISSESNGITILSEWAFDAIRDQIEPWITFGNTEFADQDKYDDIKYVWIRPIHKVGVFVDSKVLQICDKCGRPKEIRQRRSKDIFQANKHTVESFNNIEAPIVLAGNWFGDVRSGGVARLHQDAFISAILYEKIKKLKLKAFWKADYVIHAADEPYEWDPEEIADSGCVENAQ